MTLQELVQNARNNEYFVYNIRRKSWGGGEKVRFFGKVGPLATVLNWREDADGWTLTVNINSKKLLDWLRRNDPEALE